ncbi:MAG: L,D-transpeptidase family protein [Pseudomonadota bacterium]
MSPEDLVVTPTGLRFWNRFFPMTLGRSGISSHKREGDGATPAGRHGIVGMLYRPDRMAKPADWAVPILPRDLWCDDPKHEDYNLMVKAPFQGSAEQLRRADPLYDLVILTNWNWPFARKDEGGHGSAIFIHRWRRPGAATEGCIALDPVHLLWIAERISYQTKLVVPGAS